MIKKIFEIALLAIIFGFVAASVYVFFSSAFQSLGSESFKSFSGAFFGAFFVFLFIRLGEIFTKIYDRKAKHHNSLIRLQHYFNDCLNITGDNVFVADDFLTVFEEGVISRKEPRMFFNMYHDYPIDNELIIGLTNSGFLNEIYTFNIGLKKINETVHASNMSYKEVRTAFIEKNIDIDTYIENVKGEKVRCEQIKKFLLQTKSDIIRLLSISRILSKSKPLLTRLIISTSKSKYPKNMEEQISLESDKLNAEIDKTINDSLEKIDRTMRDAT